MCGNKKILNCKRVGSSAQIYKHDKIVTSADTLIAARHRVINPTEKKEGLYDQKHLSHSG
nr:MAG TPA: hypothetical protein [Caudoviricetes sp.]